MDWINDLALKREGSLADAQALSAKGDALWEGLKELMLAVHDLYMQRYPAAADRDEVEYENRNPNLQVFRRRHRDAQNQPAAEICVATVSFNAPVVTATYSTQRPPALLTVGRDNEGYAAILYNGKSVSLDRAAEILLRPVLFPDFP